MDFLDYFDRITKKIYDVAHICFNDYESKAKAQLQQLRDSSVSAVHSYLENYFSQFQWFIFDVDKRQLSTNTWYDLDEESKYKNGYLISTIMYLIGPELILVFLEIDFLKSMRVTQLQFELCGLAWVVFFNHSRFWQLL